MGHVINHIDFRNNKMDLSKKEDLNRFLSEIDEEVSHEDWKEGGAYHYNFHVEDRICNSREEAYEYLREKYTGYNDGAIRYYGKEKTATQEEKIQKIDLEISELKGKNIIKEYISSMSSRFISCNVCESKLNREKLLKKNTYHACPVCNSKAGLLSNTVIKKLEAKNIKLDKLNKKKEELKKAIKPDKNDIWWLAKYEYHT